MSGHTERGLLRLAEGKLRGGAHSGRVLEERYRLLECIGAGAMGEVYAAEHVQIGRKFAVKILRTGPTGEAAMWLHREAKAIARIESEYVVSVFDYGELSDHGPYLVMELLRGTDLRSLIDAGSPLSVARATNLIWQACHGVAAVHDAGLIHRDLKPENLFVARRATGADWCKVLDLGVAKAQDVGSGRGDLLVGTVRYMAPEQLRDSESVGQRSDVYALGAILFECLCGIPPHDGPSVHELMFNIMKDRCSCSATKCPRHYAASLRKRCSEIRSVASKTRACSRAHSRLSRAPIGGDRLGVSTRSACWTERFVRTVRVR